MTNDHNLTPAEADALFELLDDKVAEVVDNPYSPELAEAIRKVKAVADLHTYPLSTFRSDPE